MSPYALRQELHRHEAPELGVLGLVDHTHPTAAQPLQDAVAGNRFAGLLAGIGIRLGRRQSFRMSF